jgi:TPR repeat protein
VSAVLFERVWALCQTPAPPELGPGPRPDIADEPTLRQRLAAVARELKVPPRQVDLLLGSVLLWHDHLTAAHALAQQIPDADGSYLHGLMHRREPDYDNAQYWFRRAGRHAVLTPLAAAADEWLRERGETGLAGRLLASERWDCLAFVDFCEECASRPADDARHQLARELQWLEFEVWTRHLCGAI